MFGHNSFDSITWALGWALMQFLWQGALIGVIAAIVLVQMRNGSAQMRYAISCSALVCCGIAFVGTSIWALVPVESAGEAGQAVGRVGMLSEYNSRSGLMLESIAWLWVGGVVFFALRFAMQWRNARRLRFDLVSSVDEVWQGVFEALKVEMGISSTVRLMRSGLAEVPMVVGWVSPMVLIPVSAFSSLTTDQLRAVIAHELEHIRRYDHLVNAAQVVIETVLFFHPVVWWLSQQARVEREHCCDDAAVAAAGDRIIFAQALTRLESMRGTHSRAVLAINQGGSLMNRITRILGRSSDTRQSSAALRTIVALSVGALVAGAGIAHAASNIEEPVDPKIEVLRSNVDSGVMTSEQAREIFDSVIYPGSGMQQRMDAYVAEVEAYVNAAVEAGKMSAEQGQERLAKTMDEMNERLDYHFSMSVLGMTKSESKLWMLSVELRKMVESGEITQEQADAKFAFVERGIGMAQAGDEHLKKIGMDIRKQVAAGVMTPEEGREKMDAARREFQMRMKLMEVERRIEVEVEAGKMMREEADEKIAGIKRELGIESRHAEHMKKISSDIHKQIEAGVITPEEGREKIEEARRGIEMRMNREGIESRYEEHLKKIGMEIRKQIAAGVMTTEEGREKMEEARRGVEMRMNREEIGSRHEEHLKKISSDIRKQIEAGVMTPEEGREKISEAKREIGMRIKLIEVERRIEAAVEAGKMTREEADKKFHDIHEEIGREHGEHGEHGEQGERGAQGDHGEREFDWDAFERRIVGAVDAGKMTREEADSEFYKVRNELAKRESDALFGEWKAVQKHIEGAVEAGEMTRAQAKLAYEAARDRVYPNNQIEFPESIKRNDWDHLGILPYVEMDLGC